MHSNQKEQYMKKVLLAVLVCLPLVGCSNWNRATPASMDNVATTAEIKKNMIADGLTGIDVDTSGGVVTLTGHLATSADRRKAVQDARKVTGVNRVVDHIQVP
jgi:osmotically-inducible protein OsmY